MTFTVKAEGRYLKYQWLVDGNELNGETDSIVKLSKVQLSDNNKKFYCAVSNPAGVVTSQEAQLTVDKISEIIPVDPVPDDFSELFAVAPNPVERGKEKLTLIVKDKDLKKGTG